MVEYISDFQGLVTLILTLDRVILHTIMHHSSTSTYLPNFIEIKENFCGRRTYKRRSRPKNYSQFTYYCIATFNAVSSRHYYRAINLFFATQWLKIKGLGGKESRFKSFLTTLLKSLAFI